MYQFLERDSKKLYELLGFDKDNLAEVRCIDVVGSRGIVSREFVGSWDQFRDWGRSFNGQGNCFLGRNPRGSDGNIKHISCVSVDIDPDVYDKSLGATDEQSERCIEAGRRILASYGGGNLGFSGNGSLVFWTTDSPLARNERFEENLRRFQNECKELVKDFGVKIDATQDSARLIKFFGTISTRGKHRLTKLLSVQGSRGTGNATFGYVDSLGAKTAGDQKALLAKSAYPSRSEADFALVAHYKQSGLSPYDCLDALGKHALGRPERVDDHKRIIAKVFGGSWVGDLFSLSDSLPSDDRDIKLYHPSVDIEAYTKGLDQRGERTEIELPTGFAEFDKATNGLRRQEIYTVAARPAVGKTSYLLNIAHTLCSVHKRVLILSTEMPYHSVWDRICSIGSEVNGQAFTTGKFTEEEKAKFRIFYEAFKTFDIHVCDMFQPDSQAVEKAVKRVKPDVLMFDHIQHIGAGSQNEYKVLSDFTRGLKRISMEYNNAVIVASQLRRPTTITDFKTKQVMYSKPTLGDLKSCGTIEEESAFVLMLYNSGLPEYNGFPIVTADLQKNRFGPNVTTDLVFEKPITKFKYITQ